MSIPFLHWPAAPSAAERLGLAALPIAAALAATIVAASTFRLDAPQAPSSPKATVQAFQQPQKPLPTIALSGFGEPLPGRAIVSPFGLRQLPWEARARLHAGVDIVAPFGAPVRSVAYGAVSRTGSDSGYGRYVEVLHSQGVTSFYAHLSAMTPGIRVGAAVEPGAVLGQVGSSGASTGAHLHFEMRDAAGRPLDPSFFIGKAFAVAEEWPLAAAARISPKVRIATISNIPAAKLELMLARQEAAADERATLAMQHAAAEAAEAEVQPAEAAAPTLAEEQAALPAENTLPPVDPQPFAEAPPASAPEPTPFRRPRQPPRLAMPG